VSESSANYKKLHTEIKISFRAYVLKYSPLQTVLKIPVADNRPVKSSGSFMYQQV
jgi:hypothetical protein